MQVKGTMLIQMVKVIRSNKDKNWDKWLKSEDWEIINSRILPSQWYPYVSFERIGLAVFKEMAQSNLDNVISFGRLLANGMEDIYANVFVEGDPVTSIEKFSIIRKTFMKDVEGGTQITDHGPDWLKYKLAILSQVDVEIDVEAAEVFAYMMAGTLEGIVEQAGGKNISVTVEKVEDGYDYDVKWE